MKKLILSLIIAAGISAMAFAQENKKENCCNAKKEICAVDSAKCCKDADRKDCENIKVKKGKRHGKNHEAQCFKDLNLTNDQKTKLQDLRKAHHEKMVELNKSHFEDMRSILTPEQIVKLDAKKSKHKGMIKEGTIRYDAKTEAKLKELSTELQQKRDAIKRTRIAPAMMEKKLQDLNEEYAKKRSEVVEQSLKK